MVNLLMLLMDILLMVIILMDIGGYYSGGYWWLLINIILVAIGGYTIINLVICNESLCNWHETGCHLQLSWSCLQL